MEKIIPIGLIAVAGAVLGAVEWGNMTITYGIGFAAGLAIGIISQLEK